jgi:hypothetical protein
VPAITPWQDGEPVFALTDYERSARCARQRECSVCGELMARGPVWRVVGQAEADAIGAALAAGAPYRNLAPTLEGPGHRDCMLYASMVCPYLARPNARRSRDVEREAQGVPVAGTVAGTGGLVRGRARGATGAVVGFADYEFAVTADQVLFRFLDVVEFLPHRESGEHLSALQEELQKR